MYFLCPTKARKCLTNVAVSEETRDRSDFVCLDKALGVQRSSTWPLCLPGFHSTYKRVCSYCVCCLPSLNPPGSKLQGLYRNFLSACRVKARPWSNLQKISTYHWPTPFSLPLTFTPLSQSLISAWERQHTPPQHEDLSQKPTLHLSIKGQITLSDVISPCAMAVGWTGWQHQPRGWCVRHVWKDED